MTWEDFSKLVGKEGALSQRADLRKATQAAAMRLSAASNHSIPHQQANLKPVGA